jgi:hypothetical protein
MRMENTLWFEDIIAAPSFLNNFRVDMTEFMDLHKMVVKRSAFSTFPSSK